MKRVLVGDFETTVYKGQVNTEVWASALVEIGSEDVAIFHSIDETYEYLLNLKCDLTVYYHNLKFDGSFWLNYILTKTKLKPAFIDTEKCLWCPLNEMPNNTYRYSISSMGAWYSITIKTKGKKIEIRDSLKLLPFSVKKIGKSFGTKHKKLDMEYTGFRYAGCEITDEEKQYIANDVLVVKEALEIMFAEGHNKLTIGACCLSEFKKKYGSDDYDCLFPDMRGITIPESYGTPNAEYYVRKSYRGGWCYVVPDRCNTVVSNGVTADVNSLYPSMMSSESGNYYPVGKPTFWKGDFIPSVAEEKYYFVRFKCRFYIKKGYLPFVHIRDNPLYDSNENLVTSDVLIDGVYYPYINDNGVLKPVIVTLTMTCTDYILFREHYDVCDFEILDGCYFETMKGIFDDYIERYKRIKMNSTGAIRELAKLFLNNLYGKLASSDNSSYKVAYLKDNGALGWITILAHEKQVGYIPIGSAITSYARNFTIRTAQKNYHPNGHGFIYADTDSIHCDCSPDDLVGVPVHDTDFCHWKLEAQWDYAIFVRQKTYIEHITGENGVPLDVEKQWYNVKCAGMPERCKTIFLQEHITKYPIEEQHKHLTDFKVGLVVDGKLLPKQLRGGVVLVETTYEMR